MYGAVNADWDGDQQPRKSKTGFVINVNGSSVFWKRKNKQFLRFQAGKRNKSHFHRAREKYPGYGSCYGISQISKHGPI